MAGILASADAPNAASIAVMRRLGLRFSKRMVRDARELIYYGIEAADWRLSKDGPG
jgi:RimJ/RimL family protein N-acetyltransferase